MAHGILDALAPGSFLILTHATRDIAPEAISGSLAAYRSAGTRDLLRSRDELKRLFLDGLDMLEPGIVVPQRWRPDRLDVGAVGDTDIPVYAVVARASFPASARTSARTASPPSTDNGSSTAAS